jgi:hypothetical protein
MLHVSLSKCSIAIDSVSEEAGLDHQLSGTYCLQIAAYVSENTSDQLLLSGVWEIQASDAAKVLLL